MSSFSSGFDETDAMFLEFAKELNNPTRKSSSATIQTYAVSTLGVGVLHWSQWADSDDDRLCLKKAYFPKCRSLQPDDRHRFFVFDFNDQAMNRHFKNYSNPEEAHANPPHILVGRDKDWHYLCDHYMNRTFQNQMLELQSQPTPKGTQPLPENEICHTVLGRRPGYSKDLGWEPKPKARKTASASSSTTSCS
ncbi:CACTA en-spm transposon protein [Cucumis melo var. makuwa]|uniref:CACTA en-spm transposon protein n=1 Tax=Cucumis melo var. makuwa TaxID=1194695 RepID=A0A5D3C533_CUCMM|nr:CACTA en-spm transposon protein [Cucumis melo var. makuwa]